MLLVCEPAEGERPRCISMVGVLIVETRSDRRAQSRSEGALEGWALDQPRDALKVALPA